MKRVLAIIFSMISITLLVINTSAQSFGSDETFIPYLNYTLTADEYTIHSPSINSGGGEFTSWVSGVDGRIDDVSVLSGDITLSPFGGYTQAEAQIYYDFSDAKVDGELYRPSSFDIQYSPFTIKYGDVIQYTNTPTGSTTVRLDGFTLYDAIGAYFEWMGARDAYVEGEVVFRVNYVQTQSADVAHNVYKYQPLTAKYSISFGNDFSEYFGSTEISLDDITFRNETDNVTMTFDAFHNDIVSKTGIMRHADGQYNINDVYLDVESCNVRFNAVNAPFTSIIQPYAPYLDTAGYDYINGRAWNPLQSTFSYRQQHMALYNALTVANRLNQNELENIQFGDSGSPIVRVPALFLNAVSAFFNIDFFGLGFTIGNVIGVFVLAVMVLIFLRLFAGG